MLATFSFYSSYSHADTLNKLAIAFTSAGFGTLCSISLDERFVAKGLDFEDKITILEICNPFEAHASLNIDPNIVYFLPCKVVVKEVEGRVTISMIKPTAFVKLFEHDKLHAFANTIETTLIQAIQTLSLTP